MLRPRDFSLYRAVCARLFAFQAHQGALLRRISFRILSVPASIQDTSMAPSRTDIPIEYLLHFPAVGAPLAAPAGFFLYRAVCARPFAFRARQGAPLRRISFRILSVPASMQDTSMAPSRTNIPIEYLRYFPAVGAPLAAPAGATPHTRKPPANLLHIYVGSCHVAYFSLSGLWRSTSHFIGLLSI